MTHDLSLALAAFLYLAAAATLYQSIRSRSERTRSVSLVLAVLGTLLHAVSQYSHWFGGAAPSVSLPHLLSLSAFVIMLLLLWSSLKDRALYSAGVVALPIAAVVAGMEWVLPHSELPLTEASLGTAVHMVSSVLAFGLFSIAGVYAVFVFVIDHFLRNHHLNPFVRTLPALEVLEILLFRLITAGLVLLTVSLVSGLMFINDIFAQHLVHKTILSIAAWLVFGMLLLGRWRYGWRGSLAVRLTLFGVVLLLLSYFGSKFVLEVLLGQSWQS